MERLRTIRQVTADIRAEDPETAISEWFIRQAVQDGRIPAVKSGKKFLISADRVNAFIERELNGGD